MIYETTGTEVPTNRWVHLAVVLNPAGRTLTTYLNGARAGEVTNVTVTASQVIHQTSAEANRLYVGGSLDGADVTLNARLRDVRIYRIALTDQQVAAIRNNAPGRQGGGRAPRPPSSRRRESRRTLRWPRGWNGSLTSRSRRWSASYRGCPLIPGRLPPRRPRGRMCA